MLPQLVSLNQSEKVAHEEDLKLSLTVTSDPLFLDNQNVGYMLQDICVYIYTIE